MKENDRREVTGELPHKERTDTSGKRDKLAWSAPKVKRLKIAATTELCLPGSIDPF
ncbi:hypothetical protein ACFLSJ_01275 [Verrucomicrobiota bacterium]